MQNKTEKPKFKHNKKRNTAFLFEALVKELTKAVVNGNKESQKVISGIIKEHFRKGTKLDQELTLYKQFYETKQFPKEAADKLLQQVKNEHDKLNETEIYDEQSRLIGKINKLVGFQLYDNFVPGYKTLATVSQIFNKSVEPRKKILLEQEILETITTIPEERKSVEKIDSLAFRKFVEKFNDTYGKSLISEQKELLSKFITNTDDDLELKIYLNEELSRIKAEVKVLSENANVKSDADLHKKVGVLARSLNSLKIDNIDDELIKRIMLVQEFIHEVKS
jgi:hypothetical protein